MTLLDAKLKPGQTVEILKIAGEDSLRERLHEMGLSAGMEVTILGRAPFGGPLLIRFKTSFMALRSEEAACAQVTLKP
ncbi:FeoA family protein [Bdellovibrio sp. GT3]|uniref:FeoA family protein n=1 Tax=unclassified Bdellovibrio TaxID=2633795 RepID=UPI0030F2C287